MRESCAARRRAFAHALPLLFLLLAAPLGAQAAFAHMEDATGPAKGLFRFRAATLWTRYDARFIDGGTSSLGAEFIADSLGAARVATLSPIQSRVASASGAPFLLSLGRSRLDAVAREEVVPITLEYGITNRFSVGVMMPMVRRRVMVQFRLDTAGGFVANVGPNPQRLPSSGAGTQNAQLEIQFAGAISQLQARLSNCQSNPGAPGCPALLARQAEAQALIAASTAFAADVAALYGTASSAGMAFVPLATSAAHAAIVARRSAFNDQYKDLLGTTANLLTSDPSAANGPAAIGDFQRYLTQDLGRDSLVNAERVLVGDVELGARFAALDVRRERLRMQLVLGGNLRLATGSRQYKGELVDLSTGGGMIVATGRGVMDAKAGRVGLLASASFASNVRAVDTVNLASRAERWTEINLAPRWHLSDPFSVHAAWSMRSTDKEGGDQLVGGGVSISRISDFTGGPLPIEMRFTHLQAITGDPGRPKLFRDQLELRIYYRLLKR
jgi:hypothetical protein